MAVLMACVEEVDKTKDTSQLLVRIDNTRNRGKRGVSHLQYLIYSLCNFGTDGVHLFGAGHLNDVLGRGWRKPTYAFRTDFFPRYWDELSLLKEKGLVAKPARGWYCIQPIVDKVHWVMKNYIFTPDFMGVSDFYEYNVEVMVRGGNIVFLEDIEEECFPLFESLKGYKQEVEYKYIPLLCSKGRVMSKHENDDDWIYHEWVKKFTDPKDVRAVLLSIVNSKEERIDAGRL